MKLTIYTQKLQTETREFHQNISKLSTSASRDYFPLTQVVAIHVKILNLIGIYMQIPVKN